METEIWTASMKAWESEVDKLGELLTPAERHRASRFHFLRDRRRWVMTRALLRHLIARRTELSEQEIAFGHGEFGKPHLVFPDNRPLEFSVSHSGDWALIGMDGNCPIGIDIEQINPQIDAGGLAERFFSESEFRMIINSSDQDSAIHSFYLLWVMKEACMKQCGLGLNLALDAVTFAPAKMQPHRFEASGPDDNRWHVITRRIDKSHLAAVAKRDTFQCRWREIYPAGGKIHTREED